MNEFIIISAKYLFLISLLIAGYFFVTLSLKEKKIMINLGLISGLISLLLLKISSLLFNDPRPFVVNHVVPLIPHAIDNGFPSDHTLLTMWIALVVLIFNKRLGIILGLLSLIVGISRVLALVHHPIDIAGSVAIAIISVTVSMKILSKFKI